MKSKQQKRTEALARFETRLAEYHKSGVPGLSTIGSERKIKHTETIIAQTRDAITKNGRI